MRVPKIGEGGLLGWFIAMARATGDHPRSLARSGRILAEAGIRRAELTPELLSEATRQAFPAAQEWAEVCRRTGRANGHPVADTVVREEVWFAYAPNPYNDGRYTNNHRPDKEPTMATATAKRVLKIKKADAVALLREMGAGGNVVNDDTKIRPLTKMISTNVKNASQRERDDITTPALKEMFDCIEDAIKDGQSIEVIDDRPSVSKTPVDKDEKEEQKVTTKQQTAAKDKGSHKGNGKTSPANKQTTKPDKPKRTLSEGVDKFGSRIGSNNAKLNAVLTKKPHTVKELVDKAGIEAKEFKPGDLQLGAFYSHLKKLTESGHVKKTEEGYALCK